MRRYACFETLAGAIAVGCGLAAAFPPLVVIGLVLTCVGAWNLCRTSVTGVIADGVAMILTGLFQCLLGLWVEDARASNLAKWIVAGVLQIMWGVRRLAIYSTARLAANDPEAIARLESIVRELSRRSAKDDPTVVEFWTGRIRRHRNRLGLYTEGAIALLEHQVVRLEKRTDIWIESRGTTWLGRTIKAGIQMGDLQLAGEMPTAHFERFERWKLGMLLPSPIAA